MYKAKILSNVFKREENKNKLNTWITSTYIVLLSLISIMLLYYVWILNTNATKGYNIRDLEETKKILLIEKQKLNVKIAELESISTIEKNTKLYNMKEMKSWEEDYLVIKENINYIYNN